MKAVSTRFAVAALASFLFASALALADPVQEVGTSASAGGHVSQGATASFLAVGQSSGVLPSAAGSFVNYPGILGCAPVRPALDTDGDGACNEMDADNDDDALSDTEEIDGSAFLGYAQTDPNLADTDGDGMADAAEAAAMFDPLDPNHCLAVLSIAATGSAIRVTWVGKGGNTENRLYACDDHAPSTFTNLLHSALYHGGAFPWFKATNTYTDATAPEDVRMYQVRVPSPGPAPTATTEEQR